MRLPRQIVPAMFAVAIMSGAAVARPPTDVEKRALAETVEAYHARIGAGDYGALVETLPPRIADYIEEEAGISMKSLGAMAAREMKTFLSGAKIESFSMDMAATDYLELPNGEPYALIPTEMVIDGGDKGRVRAKSHALALMDENVWYLVSVNQLQHLMVLRQVYPDFAGVEFPSGSMEALK